MANSSKAQVLRTRVSELISECDKATFHIQHMKNIGNHSVELLNKVNDEHFLKYIILMINKLQQLLCFTMEFNSNAEDYVSSVLNCDNLHKFFNNRNVFEDSLLPTSAEAEILQKQDSLETRDCAETANESKQSEPRLQIDQDFTSNINSVPLLDNDEKIDNDDIEYNEFNRIKDLKTFDESSSDTSLFSQQCNADYIKDKDFETFDRSFTNILLLNQQHQADDVKDNCTKDLKTSNESSSNIADDVKGENIILETGNVSSDNNNDKVIDLPSPYVYSIEDEFDCVLTHVDNPWSIYVVTGDHSERLLSMFSEMKNHYQEMEPHFKNKEDFLNTPQIYFAVEDFAENNWYRVRISNILPNHESFVQMYCIDSGKTMEIDVVNVYLLDEKFCNFFPFAYKCKLDCIMPFPNSNEQWSDECLEYLQTFLWKKNSVTVVNVSNDCLIVNMEGMDDVLSFELGMKGLADYVINTAIETQDVISDDNNDNKTNEMCNEEMSLDNFIFLDDFEDNEYVGGDVNIRFDAANYNDEKLICRFYKGPPDTTCFKGSRCKKIHQLYDEDGLTIEKVSIGNIPEHSLPAVGSKITVYVSTVLNYKTVYVNIVSIKNQVNSPDNLQKCRNFQNDLDTLTMAMNKPATIASMKKLKHLPTVGEFLAAKQLDADMWHRTRVISVSSDSAELFFIDYGVKEIVAFENIRELHKEHMKLPIQAVQCSIVNIKEAFTGKVAEARSTLSNLVLDKNLDAEIKYVEADVCQLGVILVDKDGYDIGDMMSAHELVELHNVDDLNENNKKINNRQTITYIPG